MDVNEPEITEDMFAPPIPSATGMHLIRRPGMWSRPDNLWPIDATFAAELDRRLQLRKPRVIVEVGSGASTAILAAYAQAHEGVKVISLEHDQQHAARTLALLERLGLAEHADIHLRPLHAPLSLPGPWYANDDLPSMIDFVLVDGPPERLGGRAAVLPALWDRLLKGSGGWELWLDDADRPGERQAVETWRRWQPTLQVRELPFGKNGALMLAGEGHIYDSNVDASDVVLTLLTARRPELLLRTLDSIRENAPGLLDTAHVIALHNHRGETDAQTRQILELLRCTLITVPSMHPIGRAVGLLEAATRQSAADFWLHLEDDWEMCSAAPEWLDQARALLPVKSPNPLAQVRLRHFSEPVLGKHMVTSRTLSLHDATANSPIPHAVYPEAHLTFNPFLARVGALTKLFPTSGENEFQSSAHALGMRRVAQLYPGVFRHIGDGPLSLRGRLDGRGY